MLRFADDIALIANTEKKESKEALNATEALFNNYNTKVNIEKTKVIACRTKSGKKRMNMDCR